jgi:hypothetical protein
VDAIEEPADRSVGSSTIMFSELRSRWRFVLMAKS